MIEHRLKRVSRACAPVFFAVFVIGLSGLVSNPALAHEKKEAITRVLLNPRTGNIEVMHRFLLHDAEHAARQLFGGKADIMASEQTRTQFAHYVHQRFAIAFTAASDGDKANYLPLTLTPVGHEIEGRFLWVYAEVPAPETFTALQVAHRALRDVWPEQVNLVTIERNGQTNSLIFHREVAQLSSELGSQ